MIVSAGNGKQDVGPLVENRQLLEPRPFDERNRLASFPPLLEAMMLHRKRTGERKREEVEAGGRADEEVLVVQESSAERLGVA